MVGDSEAGTGSREDIGIGSIESLSLNPSELRQQMATLDPESGRLIKWNESLINDHQKNIREIEYKQPGGTNVRVVDRDENKLSADLLSYSENPGDTIKLGGINYSRDTLLAGLWSHPRYIFGHKDGKGGRLPANVSMLYLHQPRAGKDQTVTQLVMKWSSATKIAKALENSLSDSN